MSIRSRGLAVLLAAAAALLPGAPARADEVDDFQAGMQAALDAVGAGIQDVLSAGLDGGEDALLDALLHAADALNLQAALLTATQADPVKTALGKALRAETAALASFTRATAKATDLLAAAQAGGDASAKTLKKILAKLKAANKAGLKAAAKLSSLPRPGITLVEVGSAAGFHAPGSVVRFKVVPNPFGTPCTGPYTVTATDQSGAPVTTDPHLFDVTDPGGEFSLTMGTAGGGSRVRVDGCGTSSERLLFNYGDFGKINGTAFQLQPATLPFGYVSEYGLPYLEYVDAVGGTDPCEWSATGLPSGFSLVTVSSGGKITASTVGISGAPYNNPGVTGVFPVTITGVDAKGRIARRTYTLVILP